MLYLTCCCTCQWCVCVCFTGGQTLGLAYTRQVLDNWATSIALLVYFNCLSTHLDVAVCPENPIMAGLLLTPNTTTTSIHETAGSPTEVCSPSHFTLDHVFTLGSRMLVNLILVQVWLGTFIGIWLSKRLLFFVVRRWHSRRLYLINYLSSFSGLSQSKGIRTHEESSIWSPG